MSGMVLITIDSVHGITVERHNHGMSEITFTDWRGSTVTVELKTVDAEGLAKELKEKGFCGDSDGDSDCDSDSKSSRDGNGG